MRLPCLVSIVLTVRPGIVSAPLRSTPRSSRQRGCRHRHHPHSKGSSSLSVFFAIDCGLATRTHRKGVAPFESFHQFRKGTDHEQRPIA